MPWLLCRIISGFHIWSYFILIYAESWSKWLTVLRTLKLEIQNYYNFWNFLVMAYLCFWSVVYVPNKVFRMDSVVEKFVNRGHVHRNSKVIDRMFQTAPPYAFMNPFLGSFHSWWIVIRTRFEIFHITML